MRSFTTLSALAAVAAPLAAAQLNALAQETGLLYFGTATDISNLATVNETYYDILTDVNEFGQITPANGQKWFTVEPEQGVFDFSYGTITSDITNATGQALRCHNLVWHSQLPDWVSTSTWDRQNLTAMLKQHVYTEAKHWAGQCYAWDVVNEGLNDDGTFRDSIFYQVLGKSYFLIAFEQAALADPAAKLYYNDYNIESPGPKADAVVELVKYIQGAGLKIDGVGLQSHFVTGGAPTYAQQVQTMESYTALGVEVAQTELDVRTLLPNTDANLAQQSDDYYNAVKACVDVSGCIGVTVWDFWDPASWVPSVFTGYGSADLWFDDFTKHPAYYGVARALGGNITDPTNGTAPAKCKRGDSTARKSRRSARSEPLYV